MKVYNDGNTELRVARCPADLYIIKGVDFLIFPTSSKAVAQAFVDSWAAKKQLAYHDEYDVDMTYRQADYGLCKSCAKGLTGMCEVYHGQKQGKSE